MRCRGPGFNVAACCVAIVCLLALLRSGRAFSSCTRVPVQGSILPLSQAVHIAAEDCLYDPAVEASRDGLTVVVGCSSSTRALQSTPEGSMDSSRDALKTGRKQLAQWGAATGRPLGFAGGRALCMHGA